ncbi:MAG: pitrilysin family protein [Pseudomonadota bacterium]
MIHAIQIRLNSLTVAFLLLALTGLFIMVRPAGAVDVQKVVSPGGIEAWLVEEHTVPIIAMNFAFLGGSAQDPSDKSGVANMVSSLLDEGADDLDSQAFQRALEETQARIRFSAGRDNFYGEVRTLSFQAPESFVLLKKAINAPRFDAEPTERIRRQVLTGIKRSETDPDSIANKTLFETLFPDHPYGRRSSGTLESVQSLTRDDLVAFHKSVFTRDTLKIGVVGAISPEDLGPLLDRVFGDLPAESGVVAIPKIVPTTGARVSPALDVPQSAIRLALPSIKRADPDYLAAYVMNHILGGGTFTSRLFSEVREKRGLAYSVYSHMLPLDSAAVFFVGAGSRDETAGQTVDLILEQIRRMGEEGPTPEELQKAKDFLTGSYALRFDTSNKIAGQLLGLQLNDLPAEYINTRNDEIRALTLDDVKAMARRLLENADPSVVVVGRQAG